MICGARDCNRANRTLFRDMTEAIHLDYFSRLPTYKTRFAQSKERKMVIRIQVSRLLSLSCIFSLGQSRHLFRFKIHPTSQPVRGLFQSRRNFSLHRRHKNTMWSLLSEGSAYERTWWHESIVYQIYVHSFKDSSGDGIGDLGGVLSKLDYLNQLGVDIIQLSPIYDSGLADMGYDVRDHRKILPAYGSMNDWKTLLNEVHKNRMRLIMDLVVNSTSDEVSLSISPTFSSRQAIYHLTACVLSRVPFEQR